MLNNNISLEVQKLINQDETSNLLTENANKNAAVIPTMRDLTAGIVARNIALETLLPKHVSESHTKGELHFHDLDYSPLFPMFNCMLVDVQGMFTRGFKMGNAEIEEPKSIQTATALVAQIIAQVASHIYGGTTINRIDEVLAPYVRKSYHKHLEIGRQWTNSEAKAAIYARERVEKETYDAFQSLEYEINTIHSSNGQTPFVTLNFGLGTSWEERLIQESILKVRICGLGKSKKTAIFPKLVYTIKDGVNHKEGDPNYNVKKLALECASKRMYPDILNYHKLVETTGSFKAPMGCRSFLGVWKDQDGNEVHEGRNNLGVVSLNIPRIAIEANGSIEKFFEILDQRCVVAYDALMFRISRFDGVKASVAPILYTEGACGVRLKPDDLVADMFKNGRASISLGYIGLHEAATCMFKNESLHTVDSLVKQEFTTRVVKYLSDRVNLWKNQTNYGFSLYSTPSESLCDRFCRLDKQEFGSIAGVTDHDYYTNSYHVDVFNKVNPFDKIDFESRYPKFASGGFISYVEFPNMKDNLKGLEYVWDYTYDKIPYFGTNTPIDYCGECNFSGEAICTDDGFQCPHCGNKKQETLSVTRRVCGYLGNPQGRAWNHGKQVEMTKRVKHC